MSRPVSSLMSWHTTAVLLPPAVLAVLLALWGVDLPYWDQFALVPHFAAQAAGDFPIADLWTPHNEHRLFVPQAVMMLLASWSDWNILWELWFQYGLVVLTLILVSSLLSGSDRRESRSPAAVLLIVSLMLFSPVQWRNWIWGWQIQIFLVVLSAVAVVWFLARLRRPWLRLASASLAAVVGSLSFVNGLLLWPLAAPLVAFGGPRDDDRRPAWGQAAVWLLVGSLVWTTYFYDFLPGVDRGPVDEGLVRQVLHFGAYAVLYLGAPLLRFHDQLALWGGFVLVAAALSALAWAVGRAVLRRDLDAGRRGLPWWTLSAFAVASSVVTALGRLDFGIGQALSSRYVTIGNLFWLGLVGWLVSRKSDSEPPRRRRAPVLIAATVSLLTINAAHGIYHFQRDSSARRDLRRQISGSQSGEELRALPLQFIYPSPEEAARHLETLQELGLGPYRH